MLITFIILLFLLSLYAIYKGKVLKSSLIPSPLIALVFGIKFIGIIIFITYIGGNKEYDLIGDHTSFLNDAKVLNDVFYESPITYFKFLFGLENSPEITEQYLINTRLWSNPFLAFNDCRTVIRLHSLIDFVAFGSTHLHLLIVNFITVFSALLLVHSFSKINRFPIVLFILLTIGIPTIFIYNSLILKEHVLFFGIALFTYAIYKRKFLSHYFLLGVLLLATVKNYIFAFLLISIAIYFALLYLKSRVAKSVFLIGFLASAIGVLYSPIGTHFTTLISNQQYDFYKVATAGVYLHNGPDDRKTYYYLDIQDTSLFERENNEFVRLKTDIVAAEHQLPNLTFIDSVHLEANRTFLVGMIVNRNSGSYVQPYFIDYDKERLIKYFSSSVFYTLTQPTFNAPGSDAKYPIIFETLLVLIAFIFSLLYGFIYQRKLLFSPTVMGLLFFIISTSFLVGITTPVIGAMVRYRIPSYIAILILIFVLISPLWKRKSHSLLEQVLE